MNFTIESDGSGKLIRIFDRIAGADAFNGFVDAGAQQAVSVLSNDGRTGLIDSYKRLAATNPWTIQDQDYTVDKDDNYRMDDP